jgi:1-acyl-sn-glycerol-3-phosphate acyltransferase
MGAAVPVLSPIGRAFGTARFFATLVLFGLESAVLGTLSRVIPGPRMHFLMRFCCRNLVRVGGIRLRVHGTENMPARGGFLLVCNHANMFDPFIVYALVPRHCIAIEKASHFKWPFYGRMITSWGNLPVSSGDSELSRRSLLLAAERMREGTPVFVFPEGTRSRSGRLGAFKKGAFHLALDARVPLVPCVFKGADRIFLEGTKCIRGGVEDVVLLPPVSLESFGENDHDALSAHVHALIQAELDR